MRYMLLIVGDESQYADRSEEEAAAAMRRWEAYTQELVDAGAFVSAEGLQTSTATTTLRVEGGERFLTDGPFVETKEQVLGFYVVDCGNLDEAVDWAAKLPSAEFAVCEIRPVMDYAAAGTEDPQRQGAAS